MMRKVTTYLTLSALFFMVLCAPVPVKSQMQTVPLTLVDSLERAYTRAPSDTARLRILLTDRYAKYLSQPDPIIALYKKGYALAERLNLPQEAAKLASYIGVTYAYGKSDEGTAFQWYQKGLKWAEASQYTEGCVSINYAMGIVYDHQGMRDKMYTSFQAAWDYLLKDFQPQLAHVLVSIQTVYLADKRLDEAAVIGKKTIALFEQSAVNPQMALIAYAQYIATLREMPNRQPEVALYTNKAVNLIKSLKVDHNSEILSQIARVCFEIKEYDLAIQYSQQVLAMTQTDDITVGNQADVHEILAETYKATKNYPLSIQHYKSFMDVRTAILKKAMTEESGRKVIKAEAERDLALKQKEIERQKLYTILTSIVTAFILLLGGVGYRFYQREQKRRQELAALNATKDRLFAILSHDLMSPVATLKNYMMLMDWGAMDQAEFAEASQDLKTDVNNLHAMLENVLHWAITQMQGIKPKIEKVAVAEVINQQVALLEPIAKGKGINITQNIANDVVIDVDKNHLALIVRNLLQNALKFTNKGGQITFKYEQTPPLGAGEKGVKTTLAITDNGIGMPQETMDKLFKIEQNAHREGTAKEGGTGLGLILTKELVALNKGRMDLTSEVGKGTTFILRF